MSEDTLNSILKIISYRYTDDVFSHSFIPTIGVDFKIRTLEVDGAKIKLQLWDTAGHERFRAMVANFYRGAKGIFVVYDITNMESFLNLTSWLEEVDRHAGMDVTKVNIIQKIHVING